MTEKKQKTEKTENSEMMTQSTFESFGFKKEILDGIRDAGFKVPSPIQEQVMPLILKGKDVIAQSHTGTGKTAAFGLPIMNNMQKNIGIELLVITPTRELAAQISDEIFRLGKYTGIRTGTILGGHSYSRQLQILKNGVQVLAATPGRLLDMLKSGKIAIKEPITIVLDEADEMLDMGFLEDITEIFKFIPEKRQTLLFSATMPEPIRRLAQKILHEPVFIRAMTAGESTNIDIGQSYYVIEEHERELAVVRLMEDQDPEKAIVFCRTKLEVDKLSTFLVARGYNAKGLHGDMEQQQRNQVMTSFRKSMIDILVATDVAARGLDVADVTHVFNYHMPFDAKSYIHRVGRTGRAGHKGMAITLVTPSEFRTIQRIEKSVGSTIELKVIPTLKNIKEERIKRLAAEMMEHTPDKEGLALVEKLENEMDIRSIAVVLASMLLGEDEETGPEQIGFTESRLRQLIQRDKEGFNRGRSGGRDNRSHRDRDRHSHHSSDDRKRKFRSDEKPYEPDKPPKDKKPFDKDKKPFDKDKKPFDKDKKPFDRNKPFKDKKPFDKNKKPFDKNKKKKIDK
ncbi:MAG TPA: DEAD/DEAH box helicase [bacterium]|jgi:ATP-dependent RNA helicase DeaD|nr:DEAD/DEAH box helicase [bacterium]HNW15405.1 DEAD/DEAH box helicase [bacterium]HOB70628.1 DEAD/DEAH box helicase [bacterium]HOG44089.1 DEAD/DEAH box helicase [bacterium]HPG36615.1 DEAD/DEAH box helicase [bacterium]